ncbi:MAG: 5-(carboxyamino)imidazole ribonucleotide mutase [Spartobacteria bacterium]|nr:5-(carboxyamino)imidazole ribonucleotide mutase [Spartobacteria bacterium]
MSGDISRVAVLMGSKSDWDIIKNTAQTLHDFGVGFDVRVMSAHRTPGVVVEYVSMAEENGIQVIIAAAGMAAHLAGVVAAHTILPVIGIPMKGGEGLDSLLSTVQMPGGIPVATTAMGKAGAVNAALLAVQILSLNDAGLRDALRVFRRKQADAVYAANEAVQHDLDAMFQE